MLVYVHQKPQIHGKRKSPNVHHRVTVNTNRLLVHRNYAIKPARFPSTLRLRSKKLIVRNTLLTEVLTDIHAHTTGSSSRFVRNIRLTFVTLLHPWLTKHCNPETFNKLRHTACKSSREHPWPVLRPTFRRKKRNAFLHARNNRCAGTSVHHNSMIYVSRVSSTA